MKWIDIFRMSFGNLRRNFMRTALTISGVVVGIGAIVFLVSIGYGIQNLMISSVAKSDAITVVTVRPNTDKNLIINDTAIEKFKTIGGVTEVGPTYSYPAQVYDKPDDAVDVVVNGIYPKNFGFENKTIDYGKELSGDDAKEAVVSPSALKNLKLESPEQAIGREYNFKLVVLGEGGSSAGSSEKILKLKVVGVTTEPEIKYAYVPINVVKSIAPGNYSTAQVRAGQRAQVDTVRKAIESTGYYTTASLKEKVDQIDSAFVYVRGVLWSFGLIALFVAAIGIFNTMTISLLERTHEIGIMKAIGGRNKDVSRVFTMEASLIGFAGGVLGVAAGFLLGMLINLFVNFLASQVGGRPASFFYTPPMFVAIVVGFSFGISTIAGIYPARRAAKLNPLEALRYE